MEQKYIGTVADSRVLEAEIRKMLARRDRNIETARTVRFCKKCGGDTHIRNGRRYCDHCGPQTGER